MRAKKFISVILSIMIVCSSFAGLTVFADDTTTHTYTAVGDADFLGEKWRPDYYENDLTLQSDGTYKITYTNVAKSDLYTVKVAEDHAWGNCFGPALGDDNNIEFSVPEDNSIVDIILTLQGTKDIIDYEGNVIATAVNDGYVTVLVNGDLAPGTVIPPCTHYVAGEAGLCNGIAWDQDAPENKMTANEDGSYEITFTDVQPKSDGTPYEFKVTTNGAWDPAYGYYGLIGPGANALLMITEADSTVKIVLTKDLFVEAYVNGEKVGTSETTGECKWDYDASTQTLTISGNGEMGNYDWTGKCPWCVFRESIKEIVIENGVTSIGDYAFRYCKSLTSVTIPDSVMSIGEDAFYWCTSLKSVTIPDSVTSIGEDAFYWCKSLTSVTIPDSVTSVGNSAFYGTAIYNNHPNGVVYINNWLIGYNGNMPENTEIVIKNGTRGIAGGAFENCRSLTSVTIPDSVTSIGGWAFKGCASLTSVTIPDSVTSIGDWAFEYCTSLTDVYYGGSIEEWNKLSGDFGINNYELVSANIHYACKASQSITGAESKYDVTFGDKPFNLNASAKTTLSYTSDNTSVAEVSEDGIVTINGAGKATITITAEETTNYKSATATVEVTVGKASQKVTGFESKYDITYGDNPFSLNAKAETALYYSSDNTSVAEVSADGTVTIKGGGKATITITAEETENYKSATATVKITVNKASQKVSVAEKEYELTYGAKPFNLGAKADTTLTYVSNNLNVAEVSADGTVTINGAGTANIIIIGEETENYTSAITTVKIIVKKTSQEVTGFESKYDITYGDNPFSLNAKAETALSYASDNTSVAEVSADGTVTIKGVGTATITITADETENYNSATATVKITVAKATQRVTGVKTQYVTSAGKSFILKPKAKTKLTYTSRNKNVAVVSSTGKVTVKAGGYAYITVKASENGNYKSAYVKTKIISAPRDFTSKDVSKVKKTGKTTAKITWKSLAGAKGYTVQLATNKSYKGAKTVKNSKNTATLTGLKKGKIYYVRISAYAKVSGKNYSNKWYTVKFKM